MFDTLLRRKDLEAYQEVLQSRFTNRMLRTILLTQPDVIMRAVNGHDSPLSREYDVYALRLLA